MTWHMATGSKDGYWSFASQKKRGPCASDNQEVPFDCPKVLKLFVYIPVTRHLFK